MANIPRMKEHCHRVDKGLYYIVKSNQLENPKHFGLSRPSHRAETTDLIVNRLIRRRLYRR